MAVFVKSGVGSASTSERAKSRCARAYAWMCVLHELSCEARVVGFGCSVKKGGKA